MVGGVEKGGELALLYTNHKLLPRENTLSSQMGPGKEGEKGVRLL